MNHLVPLVRREFWEHRGGFQKTPIVVGVVLFALIAAAIAGVSEFAGFVDPDDFTLSSGLEELENVDPSELRTGWEGAWVSIATFFHMVLFFVLFFYFLNALYDDRKDRSILFWKSLPISDLSTVLSKVIAGLVLAPLLYLVAFTITQLALLLLLTGVGLAIDAPVWKLIWAPQNPLGVWGYLLGAFLVQMLWLSPLFAWLLFVSSWVKSKPFLWAVVPWVVLMIVDSWRAMFVRFAFTDHTVAEMIGERFTGGVLPFALTIIDNAGDADTEMQVQVGPGSEGIGTAFRLLGEMMLRPDMWWGILVAALLIGAAVVGRKRRTEA